jgi:predicted transcriptional regulator of viral defense system
VPVRLVRFTDRLLTEGVESHTVEGVPVKVFGVAKTVADCFRYRNKIGLSVAIEGLQEALRQRKTTPGEIVRQAERGAIATVIRPYLEALTANG